MIHLTFSAVSTFVLSKNANILDSTLTNLFLSQSPLTSSSNSSCADIGIAAKSQVFRLSCLCRYFLWLKNASSSLLIISISRA